MATAARAQSAGETETPPSTVTDAAKELNPVTVKGKRDAFSESDSKLKKLIEGLACTGCETHKIEEKRGWIEQGAEFAAHEITPTAMPDDSGDRSPGLDQRGKSHASSESRESLRTAPANP